MMSLEYKAGLVKSLFGSVSSLETPRCRSQVAESLKTMVLASVGPEDAVPTRLMSGL